MNLDWPIVQKQQKIREDIFKTTGELEYGLNIRKY